MEKKIITRRQLIKDTAKFTVGSALFLNAPFEIFANSVDTKTRVVLIRNNNLLDKSGNCNQDILQKMLDDAVLKLTGSSDLKSAWAGLIQPDDIVGIKTNVWKNLHTPIELEQVIKTRVLGTGVKEDNISIRDRGVLNDPVFQKSTALINVRPMRTHAWSGVGSLLKNYIMFTPRPSAYHDDSCADLAKIWVLPEVKGKTRLNILVMATPLFHGIGPQHFNKVYTWPYQGIIVGFDPVAVDSVGLRIIQAKRSEFFSEETPLNPPAKHIELADTRHHLGTADPQKIELIKLGYSENNLI